MRHIPPTFAALILTLFASTAWAEIRWESHLRTAHTQAQQEGKLLLLHFFNDNCVWCDRLEAGAFQAPEVAEAIHRQYVPVKIHAGQNPGVAKSFRVTSFPTDVIVTTEGTALAHLTSPQAAERYVAMLNQHTAPAMDPTRIANQTGSTAASDESLAVGEPAMPSTGTAVTAVAHRSTLNPTASSSKTVPHKLALDGFCAVSIIDKGEWLEGNPEFGVIHLGNLYLLVDESAMAKFLANPEPFTPVLNGIDVVRFFEEKKIVPGKREWGLKDPDYNRMFFFSDEAAMVHFENQYHRYADAAITVTRRAIADANPSR